MYPVRRIRFKAYVSRPAERGPAPLAGLKFKVALGITSMSSSTPNTNNTSLAARDFAAYWGPVALCMLAIFYFSAQGSLGQMSGPPLFQAARKSAHVFEFGLLALLLGRALIFTWRGAALTRALVSRAWLAGVVLSSLYATTDEFHQSFVPHREGRIQDVLLDTLSAVAALGLWYLFRARQLEPRQPLPEDQ
jgi:VanZ family protein